MWDELVDLDRFVATSAADRRRLAVDLAHHLGDDWAAQDAGAVLDALPLEHLGVSFVAVPGGVFQMGLRDDDVAELREHVAWTPEYEAFFTPGIDKMKPVHPVTVLPFVISRAPLSWREVERLSGGAHAGEYCYFLSRGDSGSLARSLGFRLPSEAELEWLARDGGRFHFTLDGARRHEETGGDSTLLSSRFGIIDIFEAQWVEDDYHSNYDGAPRTSVPWEDGEKRGHVRSWGPPEMIESPAQIASLLAAARGWAPEKAGVRLVRGLAAFNVKSY